jgi:hypothetical protein
MLHLSAVNYVEIIALSISIFYFRKLQGTVLQLFPYFLLTVAVTELIGLYTGKILHKSNAWLYNITTVIEFCFYSFFFKQILKRKANQKFALATLLIYPVIAAVNIFFIQGISNFHSNTMVLGSLLMVFFCCSFFYESVSNPEKKQIQREAFFWIVTGIFFFYLGGILYDSLYPALTHYKNDIGIKLFLMINNNLVYVLYTCFIIGFVVWKNPLK